MKKLFAKLKLGIAPLPEGCTQNMPFIIATTWFGSGRLRPAPGTIGSLTAIPIGMLLQYIYGIPALLLGIVVAFTIGVYTSNMYEEKSEEHDSSSIVIDEVVGMWIAGIPAATNIYLWILAFVLFRFFDIVKPWPISKADRDIEGGLGVMIDDVLAGIFAFFAVAASAIPFLGVL